MSTFGREVFETVGRSIQVTADGKPEFKSGGVTIDWDTVTALAADTTFLDGVDVEAGRKVLRYGQVVVPITASGKYGPWDPDAVDGRALLLRDKTFILNETMLEDEVASDHPPVLHGGKCFEDRIIHSGTDVHTLAAGPTLAELHAALPRLVLVTE